MQGKGEVIDYSEVNDLSKNIFQLIIIKKW